MALTCARALTSNFGHGTLLPSHFQLRVYKALCVCYLALKHDAACRMLAIGDLVLQIRLEDWNGIKTAVEEIARLWLWICGSWNVKEG